MSYLLIWDIDGTLIQGRGIGRKAMEKAFAELFGITDALKGVEMAGMLDSVILGNAFKLHRLDEKYYSTFINKYLYYLEIEISQLDYNIDAPGILKLLNTLDSSNEFFNALGTGNLENGARIKLSKHDMNRFFPTGGFGDELSERWQVIEKAVTNSSNFHGIKFCSDEIFVIGDTPRDVECGKKLGYKTIAVATGMHSVSDLNNCSADYVFQDLKDDSGFFNIFK
ncbi:MAG TPA: HAD hydrolase-like protein [Clostridia bacterium]|nr:HAD hydrolase-like protein [Clostridia bacterium]